jgi:hypothetical protein
MHGMSRPCPTHPTPQLIDPESGHVKQQQYRVGLQQQEQQAAPTKSPGGGSAASGLATSSLQAQFCIARDLLLVMLPRWGRPWSPASARCAWHDACCPL